MVSDEEQIKRLKSQVASSDRLLRDVILQRDAGKTRIAALESALRSAQVDPESAVATQVLTQQLEALQQQVVEKTELLSGSQGELETARTTIVSLQANVEELKASLGKALDGWKQDKTLLEMNEDALAKVKLQRDRLSKTAAESVEGLREARTQVEELAKEIEALKGSREGAANQVQVAEYTRVTQALKVAEAQTVTDRVSLERIGEGISRQMQLNKELNTKLAEAEVKIRALEETLRAQPAPPTVAVLSTESVKTDIAETPVVPTPNGDVLNAVNTPKASIVSGMKLRNTNSKKQREVLLVEVVKGNSACVSTVGKPNSTRWMQCEVLAQLKVLPA